jgi:nucleoredoxin
MVAEAAAAADAAAATPVPVPPEPTMEDLLGKTLWKDVTGKTATTKSLLKGKQFVLLYFSASFCPPCLTFTPMLKHFYEKYKKQLEIVYLSSDRKESDFTAYYGQMPWTALQNEEQKQALSTLFQIRGIPTLIVLDVATARVITMQGRQDVTNNNKDFSAFAKWQATAPITIHEATGPGAAGAEPQRGVLRTLVMSILTNPLYIFGTIYIVKWLWRKFSAMTATDEPAKLTSDAPQPDDEF